MTSSDNERLIELINRLHQAAVLLRDTLGDFGLAFVFADKTQAMIASFMRGVQGKRQLRPTSWPEVRAATIALFEASPKVPEREHRFASWLILDSLGVRDPVDASWGEVKRALMLLLMEVQDELSRQSKGAGSIDSPKEPNPPSLPQAPMAPSGAPPRPPASINTEIFHAGLDHELAVGKPIRLREKSKADKSKTASPSQRVVNTGFSPRNRPENDSDPTQALASDREYWFWVEIGKLLSTSIEKTPVPLPGSLPVGAELTVAVFAFEGQLRLEPSADAAILRLTGNGDAEVIQQAATLEPETQKLPLARRRALFPVTTPERSGTYHLRCNIYHNHVLLQSRLVTAAVGQAKHKKHALQSVLDYRLSNTLDPAHLQRLGTNDLSIYMNRNADGTHGFMFEGKGSFRATTTLDPLVLQDAVTQMRKAMRIVAWGKPDLWTEADPYRYASKPSQASFEADLKKLAVRGYLLYDTLISKISGGSEQSNALAEKMRHPGRIQISSKEHARLIFPAALMYDHPLDTQIPLSICSAFLDSLARQDLARSPCLQGNCPHFGSLSVVCPSGFWGFRHEIGLPVSLQSADADAAPEIEFSDSPVLVVVVSLDPKFVERDTHEKQLKTIRNPITWLLCQSRETTFSTFAQKAPHIVYFYCHGGVSEQNTPFLSIGNNEFITPDNIRAYRIRWKAPRPLIFLNGCMTTALEPEKALDFVSTFVAGAHAAGVIGSEITLFEPLATKFAEAFFHEFLTNSKSLGFAIRYARLQLLQQHNPLGLVYIPFALPCLKMLDQGFAAHSDHVR